MPCDCSLVFFAGSSKFSSSCKVDLEIASNNHTNHIPICCKAAIEFILNALSDAQNSQAKKVRFQAFAIAINVVQHG